jgi:hypothetical protein
MGLYFALSDPDRLQSEEFVIRQQELTMIERKGGDAISPAHFEPAPDVPSNRLSDGEPRP